MTAYDPCKAVRSSNAAQLSKMMGLDPAAPDPWTTRDLPGMLRHQLTDCRGRREEANQRKIRASGLRVLQPTWPLEHSSQLHAGL